MCEAAFLKLQCILEMSLKSEVRLGAGAYFVLIIFNPELYLRIRTRATLCLDHLFIGLM